MDPLLAAAYAAYPQMVSSLTAKGLLVSDDYDKRDDPQEQSEPPAPNYKDFGDTEEFERYPFRYGGRWYCVSEFGAESRAKYQDKQIQRMKMAKGEAIGFKSFEGVEWELLEKCVHECEVDLTLPDNQVRIVKVGSLVPADRLRKWPSKVIGWAYEKAQEMNGLGASAKEDAKKP